MMKNKKRTALLALCLAGAVSAGAVAYAASTAGTSSDPLVSLSYLTGVFQPTVMSEVDKAVSSNETQLKSDLNTAISNWDKKVSGAGSSAGSSAYTVVTLASGESVVGSVGCEVMLRVGSAKVVTKESTGLIDTTAGSTLAGGGALSANHLYMVTIDTRTVTATAATTKLLVRGTYTVSK